MDKPRRVGHTLYFDEMAWPLPDPDLEWRFRYDTPSQEDLLRAASILCAYATLVIVPQRRRNTIASIIKRYLTNTVGAPRAS